MAVAVVGSINEDLIVNVPRLPEAGETVLGHGHLATAGGKGANQAMVAARLGAEVAFVGRVGDDAAGRSMRAAMAHGGVDVTHIGVDAEARTGLAVITLDDMGENSIVVSAGANGHLTTAHVDDAASLLDHAAVTLLQMEVPIRCVMRAARLAGHRLVLNPAPAQQLPDELLEIVDVLVPNRTELGLIVGVPAPQSVEEAVAAARRIRGPGAVVVTLGADGAVVLASHDAEHITAPDVAVVDTTGAGDAFCGAIAAFLADGADLIDAVTAAVYAGAAATRVVGAQGALPTKPDLDALMADR